MASVCFLNSKTDIDYSCLDGRVRQYIRYDGKLMYDEDQNIAEEGWENDLVNCVVGNSLNVDDGKGYHAFVLKLADEGKIELR